MRDLDPLPKGSGCWNCDDTGYIHDESFANDQDGCSECQDEGDDRADLDAETREHNQDHDED